MVNPSFSVYTSCARLRSPTGGLSRLFVSLRSGRPEQMETGREKLTRPGGCDRSFEERRPDRAREFAPSRTHQHDQRAPHRRPEAPRSPPLAQLNVVAAVAAAIAALRSAVSGP